MLSIFLVTSDVSTVAGAIMGGISGGFGDTWNFGRVMASGMGGGASSEIMGGEFSDGFKVAFFTAAAAYVYSASTNYEETANWNKGGDTPNGPDGLGTYDENGRIPFKNNIFGDNKRLTGDFWDDFTKQGGFVSKVGNSFPGGGAISRVHDAWLSPATGYGNLPMSDFTNYGTMPFAAALTYTALAADQVSTILIVQNINRDY